MIRIAAAGLVIVLIWIAIWMRFREAEPVEPPPPPDLSAWELPGCYRVYGEAWSDSTPASRELPARLLLVPDSLDQWGRRLDTYRAEPLDGEGERVSGASYRWFVRADTLWIVWTEPGSRGGIALRRNRDGLLGRARAAEIGGAGDATARVEAWPINCATGEVEGQRRVRR